MESVPLRALRAFSEIFFIPRRTLRCDLRDVTAAYGKEIPDFPFVSATAAYGYSDEFVRAFRAYKFSGDRFRFREFLPGVRVLSEYASERFPKGAVVTFPPSDPVSDFVRGYPCAESFAHEFSRFSGFPVLPVFERVRKKDRQSRLDAAGRMRNVAGAFRIRKGFEGRLDGVPAIVFDDVVSSGATASECGRALLAAGVPKCF